jgi:dipeptidyl aminopeptidase/acylaminoacyl peptidase
MGALSCVVTVTQMLSATGGVAKQADKHRITVADTIRMTSLPDTTYAAGDPSSSRYARFSPDGKKFVVVTEKGNPKTNENEFSLLIFETAEALRSPKPKVLVSMRSRSNRDAIKNVKWVGNENLYFIGEVHNTTQIYSLSIVRRELRRWTNHPTPIVDFDVDEKGEVVVYAAEPGPPSEESVSEKIDHGYAITLETLGEIPRSRADFHEPDLAQGEEVFVKHRGEKAVRVPLRDRYLPLAPVSVAPGGQHAVFAVLVREVPPWWIEYEDEFIRPEVKAYRRKGSTSWLMRYMLLDTKTKRAEPLLRGPVAWSSGTAWSAGGKSIAVSGAFLPLDISDAAEREAREKHPFAVEVELETGHFEKITGQDLIVTGWDAESNRLHFRPSSRTATYVRPTYVKGSSGWVEEPIPFQEGSEKRDLPEITLEQDLNTPPKLYAKDRTSGKKSLLLDPNPQFAKLEFGKVEAVSWKATDGHEVEGGLYLPPDYQQGVRYPLVLQTHGFSKEEFWINGPWNSGFAAQPLAGRGIVVLQIGHGTEPGGYMKHHRSMGEAPREMAAFEGAIDYLDGRGIIDREEVGIIAFSRTQYHVEYTLTHSSYHFVAATLVDGFEGGYLQYLINPYSEKDDVMVNGGPPFGATFANWLEHSPSFRIDRVHTPVRVECHDWGIAGCWEWYSVLTHMEKPVELIYLPDAVHILVKPWERLTSQQGNVDWFCFWLKGEEDEDPKKHEQYERWRGMRKLQEKSPENGRQTQPVH